MFSNFEFKKAALAFASASFLMNAPSAFAVDGGAHGGGGAQIVAAFRLKGYDLISQIANNPVAASFCSATNLQDTLDTTQIDVVPRLINPDNNQPITQLLDAWTVPQRIQLLQDSWQNMVGIHDRPYRIAKSVEVLILHEMYRATGNCHDENFVNSEKAYAVLSGKGQVSRKFSEVFVFKYFADLNFASNISGTLDSYFGICDRPAVVGATVTCLRSDTALVKKCKVQVAEGYDNGTTVFECKDDAVEVPPSGTFSDDLDNQIKQVTPEHQFILVHDIDQGVWTPTLQ